jgi:hypothetical protein
MKTRFSSKMAMFKHGLEFKVVIFVCYTQQTFSFKIKKINTINLGYCKNHYLNLGLNYIKLCVESTSWLLVVD